MHEAFHYRHATDDGCPLVKYQCNPLRTLFCSNIILLETLHQRLQAGRVHSQISIFLPVTGDPSQTFG